MKRFVGEVVGLGVWLVFVCGVRVRIRDAYGVRRGLRKVEGDGGVGDHRPLPREMSVSFGAMWVGWFLFGFIQLSVIMGIVWSTIEGPLSGDSLNEGVGFYVQFALGLVVLSLFVAFTHRRSVWKSLKHYASFVVGLGKCPSCLYEIDQVPAQEDGIVVCPECGGAWWRDEG